MIGKLFAKLGIDPVERAFSTFVQQLLVILVVSGGSLLVTQNWAAALATAGFAALVSLLMTLGRNLTGLNFPGTDLEVRAINTFIQSFVGTMVASGVTDLVHVNYKSALTIALVATATSILKNKGVSLSVATAAPSPVVVPAPIVAPVAVAPVVASIPAPAELVASPTVAPTV